MSISIPKITSIDARCVHAADLKGRLKRELLEDHLPVRGFPLPLTDVRFAGQPFANLGGQVFGVIQPVTLKRQHRCATGVKELEQGECQ